jgi:hypothetical protein
MCNEDLGAKERVRLKWVRVDDLSSGTGLTCWRCRIIRPNLRKCIGRFLDEGTAGLKKLNKQPRTTPDQKVYGQEAKEFLELGRDRQLGDLWIQLELMRNHDLYFSLTIIQKVINLYNSEPLKRRWRGNPHCYDHQIPGTRVEVDMFKISFSFYQYGVIDECPQASGGDLSL